MDTHVAFDKGVVALIGVPSSAGARLRGQELAPDHLRRAGLVEHLTAAGFNVLDLGDTPVAVSAPDVGHPTARNLTGVLRVLTEVRRLVAAAVRQRAWPLVVGGDCTTTLGVLAGLTPAFPDLGLMYLDADVDLNTPGSTHSGILDGMVLGHILGGGADALSHLGERHPLMDETAVTLFGYSEDAGGIDPAELAVLRDTRMDLNPLEQVQQATARSATQAMADLETRVEHILVHFDVDVIDAREFPAVDVPHVPGLPLAGVQQALNTFVASPKAVGLVVTEFNAALDSDGKGVTRLTEMIHEAISGRGQVGR